MLDKEDINMVKVIQLLMLPSNCVFSIIETWLSILYKTLKCANNSKSRQRIATASRKRSSTFLIQTITSGRVDCIWLKDVL